MPGDTMPNFNDVIAALQLLGSGPGGVQNMPVHDMQQGLMTAIGGQTGDVIGACQQVAEIAALLALAGAQLWREAQARTVGADQPSSSG